MTRAHPWYDVLDGSPNSPGRNQHPEFNPEPRPLSPQRIFSGSTKVTLHPTTVRRVGFLPACSSSASLLHHPQLTPPLMTGFNHGPATTNSSGNIPLRMKKWYVFLVGCKRLSLTSVSDLLRGVHERPRMYHSVHNPSMETGESMLPKIITIPFRTKKWYVFHVLS
jgi:hypothetical protein